jgi:subtilisin family serine protease
MPAGARTVSRVWRNSRKFALLETSVATVQAAPAHVGYRAMGRGITWAVLDSGIVREHPHFAAHDTIEACYDCTGTADLPTVAASRGARDRRVGLDENGHGTHVAGIIAGKLEASDKDKDKPKRSFIGIAPETKLHIYKVLDREGNGEDAWIIKALDHIAETNERAGQLVVHGVNLSLGGPFDQSTFGCGHTPLCVELRRLWRQGVIVVLAAGNEGFAVLQTLEGTIDANMDLTIGDPANLEEAIAVGSVHKTNPHTYGVSYFSSRGPTADGRQKPDLVAPGERIMSCRHRYRKASAVAEDLYVEMSGTSMAAPHVSGLVAAFLSVRREFIGNPDRVKEILLGQCTDLKRDRPQQGAGMPNLVKMLVST